MEKETSENTLEMAESKQSKTDGKKINCSGFSLYYKSIFPQPVDVRDQVQQVETKSSEKPLEQVS